MKTSSGIVARSSGFARRRCRDGSRLACTQDAQAPQATSPGGGLADERPGQRRRERPLAHARRPDEEIRAGDPAAAVRGDERAATASCPSIPCQAIAVLRASGKSGNRAATAARSRGHLGDAGRGVDHDAVGMPPPRRDSRPEPLPEFLAAALELVERPSSRRAAVTGSTSSRSTRSGMRPRGDLADAADDVGIEPAGMPLVDDVGEEVAVGDDPLAAGEGRADHLRHQLRRAAM